MKKILAASAIALALSGCASGYAEFYESTRGITPQLIAEAREAAPAATPLVEHYSKWNQETIDGYLRRGYAVIGSSSFTSGYDESDQSAIKQAKAVGADLVAILRPKYAGTVTASMPVTTPTTTTSYSTGSATVYGPRGPVTAYGSGSTTTFGSTTTYIPMAVDRSEYGAVYLVKAKVRLGLIVRELTDLERRELKSNKGIAVRLVIDDSPAYDADILPGDVITTIDGAPAPRAEHFGDFIAERAGRLVDIGLVRQGARIQKTIQLKT